MRRAGVLSIQQPVGRGSPNNRSDLAAIISLLNRRKKNAYYSRKMKNIMVPALSDKHVEQKIVQAIIEFQLKVQGLKKEQADGIVAPNGNTIYFMGGVRRDGKQIVVDMDDQHLYTFMGKQRIHKFYCATGDKYHPTVKNAKLFHVFRKHKKYRSRTYNAQMNYAMFFPLTVKPFISPMPF